MNIVPVYVGVRQQTTYSIRSNEPPRFILRGKFEGGGGSNWGRSISPRSISPRIAKIPIWPRHLTVRVQVRHNNPLPSSFTYSVRPRFVRVHLPPPSLLLRTGKIPSCEVAKRNPSSSFFSSSHNPYWTEELSYFGLAQKQPDAVAHLSVFLVSFLVFSHPTLLPPSSLLSLCVFVWSHFVEWEVIHVRHISPPSLLLPPYWGHSLAGWI